MEGAVNFSAADMAVVLYGVQKYPKIPKNTARPVINRPAARYPFHFFLFLFSIGFTLRITSLSLHNAACSSAKGNICPAAFIHSYGFSDRSPGKEYPR